MLIAFIIIIIIAGILMKCYSRKLRAFLNDKIFSKIRGAVGERKIELKLDILNTLGYKGYELHNIYLPTDKGDTSEIDVIYITEKGIFVIESKYFSGYIFGSEKNVKWTATYSAGKGAHHRRRSKKHSFYNPIKQNRNHIKHLQNIIGQDIPCYSIIVFSNEASFKQLDYSSQNVAICHQRDMASEISAMFRRLPDILSPEKASEIFNTLSLHTNVSKEDKKAHVDNIQDTFINNTVCPLCGGELIMRTSSKGKRAGRSFMGCSNYPRCKYTRDIK